jgi:hypothetical protein
MRPSAFAEGPTLAMSSDPREGGDSLTIFEKNQRSGEQSDDARVLMTTHTCVNSQGISTSTGEGEVGWMCFCEDLSGFHLYSPNHVDNIHITAPDVRVWFLLAISLDS